MGNHHALRVIAPTIWDYFDADITGKRLRFFGDRARKKWPLQGSTGGLVKARCIAPLRLGWRQIPSPQHACINEAL